MKSRANNTQHLVLGMLWQIIKVGARPLLTARVVESELNSTLAGWADVDCHCDQASGAGPHHQSRRGLGCLSRGKLVSHAQKFIRAMHIEMACAILPLQVPPEKILCRWVNYHLQRAGCARTMENFASDIKVAASIS